MKTERSDVQFPLWRKKVDASFLDGVTPIPYWVCSMWMLEDSSPNQSDLIDRRIVSIRYKRRKYQGHISVTLRRRAKPFFRLFFEESLADNLKQTFLMSYMRSLENKLSEKKLSEVENDIPFWEFIDIEFDSSSDVFRFVPYFVQKPSFPNLFTRLIDAPTMKVIDDEIQGIAEDRIHKQAWKKRTELEFEIGAKNVIYYLLDSKRKLLYIGEAEDLVRRLHQPHPSINEWDYFRYNVLPQKIKQLRIHIERMLITDFAYFFANKRRLEFFDLSGYSLANDKIDSG